MTCSQYNTLEETIKNPINWVEGDLVHEKPDWAEFPVSTPDTNISSFYSGSVLLLGSGIL